MNASRFGIGFLKHTLSCQAPYKLLFNSSEWKYFKKKTHRPTGNGLKGQKLQVQGNAMGIKRL